MLSDLRKPVVPSSNCPDIGHLEAPETLGEQIVVLSGWGHGITGAQPEETVKHKVTVGDEQYTVLDKGYNMSSGHCTICITSKDSVVSLRIAMENPEGIFFEPPSTEAALDLFAKLISEGTWEEPELV
jgi:hypothetical protein